MNALILKDVYTLWRQTRIFILLILVFSAIPSTFNNMFAIVYASMLPYTALAYDERSKWDQMAAMMPFSVKDIVLSKYVLGWLSITAAAVFELAVQSVLRRLASVSGVSGVSLLLSFCMAFLILDITLPAMFRFGVEQGRMIMFLVIAVTCGGVGIVNAIVEDPNLAMLGKNLTLLMPIAAVLLTALSVPLSIRLYQKRCR